MRMLLWKDLRLNRAWMISGVAIWFVVYAIGLVIEIAAHWPEAPTQTDWAGMLNSYGGVSLFMTCAAAAMFAGNSIAAERAERSAHFLAYLPPAKWEILASKFIVAAGVVGVVWVWALVSLYVLAPGLDPAESADGPQLRELVGICVLIFGVGWMCSAELAKPVGAMVMALAAPVVVGMVLEGMVEVFGWPRSRGMGVEVNLVLGVGAFVLGTWQYLRRVEP